MPGTIRVGIGGWDYDPWRETFYPPGLPKARQLEHASRRLTAIEINATYYKLQKPELFAKWRDIVPDGFKFALKASRFCSNRKVLSEGDEGIAKFFGQGMAELGDKLGPILWQLMATKRFDPDDFAGFLQLLPKSVDGVPLTHVVEAEHESFRNADFVRLCREAGVGIAYIDGPDSVADVSGSVVYARLKGTSEDLPSGYPPEALDRWAACARRWAAGRSPDELPLAAPSAPAEPRDTYVFVIGGAKLRNPAAAEALISRLSA